MFQKSDISIVVESDIYCIVEGEFPELERQVLFDLEEITISPSLTCKFKGTWNKGGKHKIRSITIWLYCKDEMKLCAYIVTLKKDFEILSL